MAPGSGQAALATAIYFLLLLSWSALQGRGRLEWQKGTPYSRGKWKASIITENPPGWWHGRCIAGPLGYSCPSERPAATQEVAVSLCCSPAPAAGRGHTGGYGQRRQTGIQNGRKGAVCTLTGLYTNHDEQSLLKKISDHCTKQAWSHTQHSDCFTHHVSTVGLALSAMDEERK